MKRELKHYFAYFPDCFHPLGMEDFSIRKNDIQTPYHGERDGARLNNILSSSLCTGE